MENQLVEVFKNELDELNSTVKTQMQLLSKVTEMSSNTLLQIDNSHGNIKDLNSTIFTYKQKLNHCLLKILKIYIETMNSTCPTDIERKENFKIYYRDVTKKLEYVTNFLRRLQILTSTCTNMRNKLDSYED